ncbi:MAG: PD-(D/E)XK nuclease family protein, partial [Alphaproteobacteria bacterium]|nr:PD-(D/E)XK nuclease family protein [Alphaproteobacteria bacterium]
EEALAIALILRETLETPLKTAALVTNDRMLARRVILEMKRWGVELDDSAGTPLHHTPVGVYLSLIAALGRDLTSSSPLLSLLKHPLSADGKMPTDFRKEVKKVEKQARKDQKPFQIPLNTNLNTFLEFFKENKPVEFEDILNEHLKIAEELATSLDRTGTQRLWESQAGQEAYKLFVELKEHSSKLGLIQPTDYPNIIELFLSGISVRARYGMHQRLDILGPIEARLTHPDVCIISGLNEGSFPILSDMGPWLSRGMRKSLKLPAIENKIASQSMDFAHCFLSPEVYLTRSVKSDGSQTIPSRFISRMEAVLNASHIKWDIQTPDYARLLDKADKIEQTERPSPTPPVESRPTKLSVTNIELLMKNPYAVYAKHILKLFPLNDIDDLQENLVYGSAVHQALEEFFQKDFLNVCADELKARITSLLKEKGFNDVNLAFYEEKIEKVSEFIANEQDKRKVFTLLSLPEQKGEISFSLKDGSCFTLTAKADRIDSLKGNIYELIDYKTGTPPSGSEVESGLSPQMTLEAVILRE